LGTPVISQSQPRNSVRECAQISLEINDREEEMTG